MRSLTVILLAAATAIAAATIVWTAIWMDLFLLEGRREAMSIGIIPTVVGTALDVWILFFALPRAKGFSR